MDVLISVAIPDYVYEFYKTGAEKLHRETPEELMAIALKQYAGIVAMELLKEYDLSLDGNE